MANFINPCWPTNSSLIKLIIPIQITGETSTPPMGGINFFVIFKIWFVGNVTIIQKPLFPSILGYQVIINLTRNTKVRNDNSIPKNKSKIGRKL